MAHVMLVQANTLQIPLKDKSVHCCVTSPPYWNLRDYGIGADAGEIGREDCHDCLAWAREEPPCLHCYVCALRRVCAEISRVLRNDGTLWLNLGDAMAGSWGAQSRQNGNDKGSTLRGRSMLSARQIQGHPHGTHTGSLQHTPGLKAKNLCMIPARVALALQSDGWTLRSEIIWAKPSCMPESVRDRPTRSHEQVFLFSKAPRYFFDAQAIAEVSVAEETRGGCHKVQQLVVAPGAKNDGFGERFHPTGRRNARSVWTISTHPTPEAHFATMAPELARRCILAGSSQYGVCSACGSPYTRIVERQRLRDGQPFEAQAFARPEEPYRPKPNGISHMRYSTHITEHGWQASCSCNAPVTPATVFDPFCGSGTTLLAARRLGRHGVGADLSLPYLRNIARERLGLIDLARWQGSGPAAPRETYTDLPLFTLT